MAGLVPLQPGDSTHSLAGPSSWPDGDAGLDDPFATVLSKAVGLRLMPETPPATATRPSAAELLDPAQGAGSSPAEFAQLGSAVGQEQPVTEAGRTRTATNHHTETLVAKQAEAPASHADKSQTMAQSCVVARSRSGGDKPAAVAKSIKPPGNLEPGQDTDEAVSRVLREMPNVLPATATCENGSADNTTPSTAATPGRTSDRRGEVHIRASKQSGQQDVSGLQVPVQQIASGTSFPASGQAVPPLAAVSTPAKPVVPLNPRSAAIATVPQARATGISESTSQSLTGNPELRTVQPHTMSHLAEAPTPVVPPVNDTALDKSNAGSDVVSLQGGITVTADTRDTTPGSVSLPAADQSQPVPAADRAAPADQIAPAVVGILQAADGSPSVTVRLQPAELGQVQIRIDQTIAGSAHVDIIASRPETLQLLQRDEPRLQQALDQAGVVSTGRTVSFQMAPPEPVAASASRPDGMATGSGASGQGHSGGAGRQNGDAPNNFGQGPGADQQQSRTRWFRMGLDITA